MIRSILKTSFAILVCGLAFSIPASAQLTKQQKLSDFQQLAAIYAKNYKPYEWKMQVFGFDLFAMRPWIEKIENSKDDLEFYDICIKYVASLKDGHDGFTMPSDFIAELPLFVDIYDNKVLIEGVDRSVLPSNRFPIRFGDELVSVDGKSVEQWIEELVPYSVNGSGNPATARRIAADTIVFRYQGWYPYAPMVGETSQVVIRSADGSETSYEIPWDKSGTPIFTVGPVPDLLLTSKQKPLGRRFKPSPESVSQLSVRASEEEAGNPWGSYTGPTEPTVEEPLPGYLAFLRDMATTRLDGPETATAGFGFRNPVFFPPTGFTARLGGASTDQFVSGTFPLGDYRVGFIRIPTMLPSNQTVAITQFQNEIAYFNQNTRGLVIDVMHNGGGSGCYVETLVSYLMPRPYRGFAYEIRATEFWTGSFSSQLTAAKNAGAEPWIVQLYQNYLDQVQQARKELRGSTGSLPICGPSFEDLPPARDRNGNVIAYNKPIMVLTNEFTISAGEAFTAMLQDEGRATILGTRTAGAGGNPFAYNAGQFSMGSTRATRTLSTRARLVTNPGFPPANHIENTGVYPEYWEDFQSELNLLTGGEQFVSAFTAVMADIIARNP